MIQQAVAVRPGRGRPPIGPVVAFRLQEEYKELVEEEAKELGCPAADIWREIAIAGYWARRGSA